MKALSSFVTFILFILLLILILSADDKKIAKKIGRNIRDLKEGFIEGYNEKDTIKTN
jgi:hypothetical protein